jgi:hypothetical protein
MAAIRAVANAYLHLPDTAQVPHVELFGELVKLPHIGEWSAARIVANTNGDFSFYAQAGFGPSSHWRRHAAKAAHAVKNAHSRPCGDPAAQAEVSSAPDRRSRTGRNTVADCPSPPSSPGLRGLLVTCRCPVNVLPYSGDGALL